MKPERVNALATEAYRLCGYKTIRFRDGSLGILRCPAKTIQLMQAFQDLLLNELEAGSAAPIDPQSEARRRRPDQEPR